MAELTVATWNLENLFSAGQFAPASDVYDQKLDGIAATVTGRGVQVLAVQEVGDQQAFDDLGGRLRPGWTGVLSSTRTPAASGSAC